MKNRLNITIKDSLVEEAKRYAAKNNTSLSQLIEESLTKIVARPKPKSQTFLEFIDSLPKSKRKIIVEETTKQAYYESRKKKYGF